MTPSPLRRSAPVGVAAALALSFALGLAAPAAAHNFIVSSTPTEGEALTELPEQWQITTNETLLDLGGQGAGFAMLVSDAEGRFYGDGCVTIDDSGLSMPAALGTDGDYTLTYQFISSDGHTLSGELPFSWQSPAGFEPHGGLAEPPACGETASAPAPEPSTTAAPPPPASDEPSVDTAPRDQANEPYSVVSAVGIGLGALALIATIVVASRRRAARATDPLAPEPGESP